MFLGHFGFAFAAKKVAPKASLGILVLAAQLADTLWPLFLMLGIEQVRIAPGLMPASPFDFTSYPISHSLVAQLGWAAVLGLLYFVVTRDGRSAAFVGCLVPTHWVLDFVAHRPDMPVYPGGPRFGLGMWNSIPLTLFVEYGLFAVGVAVYAATTRAKDRTGNFAWWSLVGLLATLYPAALFGPPPPSVKVLAWSGISLWLTASWAAWADWHRQAKVDRRGTKSH